MLVGVVGSVLSVLLLVNSTSTSNLALMGISVIASLIISILGLVGFILFLVAMYGFSKDYAEPRIFNYIIYGIIGSIISAVVIVIVWFVFVITAVLSNFTSLPTGSGAIQSWLSPYLSPLTSVTSLVMLVWIFFNYKAYNFLAEKSKVPIFRTAAKIFVAGAIINIGVGILFAVLSYAIALDYRILSAASLPGGIVQYAAWALMAKGFFKIQDTTTQTITPSTYTPTTSQTKSCSNCGATNQTDAIYCSRCGQKL
jgi:uncharacterized membrane protein